MSTPLKQVRFSVTLSGLPNTLLFLDYLSLKKEGQLNDYFMAKAPKDQKFSNGLEVLNYKIVNSTPLELGEDMYWLFELLIAPESKLVFMGKKITEFDDEKNQIVEVTNLSFRERLNYLLSGAQEATDIFTAVLGTINKSSPEEQENLKKKLAAAGS